MVLGISPLIFGKVRLPLSKGISLILSHSTLLHIDNTHTRTNLWKPSTPERPFFSKQVQTSLGLSKHFRPRATMPLRPRVRPPSTLRSPGQCTASAAVGAEAERLTASLAAALTKPLQASRPTAARLAPRRRPLGYLSAGRRTWRGPGRGGGRGGTVAGRARLPSFSSWLGLPGPQEPPH